MWSSCCSLFFKKEMELSLIGLQNAGKTSLVNVIASGAFHEDMIPTVGFNMRKVTRGAVTIKLWDLGGSGNLPKQPCPFEASAVTPSKPCRRSRALQIPMCQHDNPPRGCFCVRIWRREHPSNQHTIYNVRRTASLRVHEKRFCQGCSRDSLIVAALREHVTAVQPKTAD